MKTILVPTDFSENSKNALRYAYGLAKAMDAKIHLFHAYHIPYIHAEMPAGMYQTAINEAEQESKEEMEKMAQNILKRDEAEGVACEYEARLGFAVEEVLNAAERNEADLIIMGTQGINGVADAIFGSITSSVIDKAEGPVMAVPEHSEFKPYDQIAFATSYDASDLQALQELATLAKAFEATIKVVHVNKEGENIQKEQEDDFKKLIKEKVDYHSIQFEVCEADDIAEGINKYVDEHRIDLIGLMKKKRGMFQSLFHKSITRKMAFHASVPLLAYHE